MKRLVIGILAHVDAGKTTLSEALLYKTEKIRKLGRVDNKDAFLDNNALERERGITIFSKQAIFEYENVSFTLIDTPGHVDFSTEMERALSVLDIAILVISGTEGIQAHTRTLWKLLKTYDIPTLIFVNKMDRSEFTHEHIVSELVAALDEGCIDFTDLNDLLENDRIITGKLTEQIAVCEEEFTEKYLENEFLELEDVRTLIAERELFPCFFGSALKLTGIDEFLHALSILSPNPVKTENFGARVFKIGRDDEGNRLTYLKITGGELKNRDILTYRASFTSTNPLSLNSEENNEEEIKELSEKVTQLRIYQGEKYTAVDTAEQGMLVAATGLSSTYPGQLLGSGEELFTPCLVPVLTYRVVAADRSRILQLVPVLKQLEEEDPSLNVIWNSDVKELQVQIMGEVQLEVLKRQLRDRFKEDVDFDKGSVLYKESVMATTLGVGHFEPLRHYAEVQLLIEPAEPGNGVTVESALSTNELDLNWQRLIITHVLERVHRGVLTGAPLTDVNIVIVAGRAHIKHTEGGDFRQATYRAIRQGLMRALTQNACVLLEPYYEINLEIPRNNCGRAMNDIECRFGKITAQYETGADDIIGITAIAPVASMQGYSNEVKAYTKGLGSIYYTYYGYLPCHNSEEVIKASGYLAEADLRNTASSVFCAHGSGFIVEWADVDSYKHLNWSLDGGLIDSSPADNMPINFVSHSKEEKWIGYEEVDAIIERTAHSNKREKTYKNPFRKHRHEAEAVRTGTSYSSRQLEANANYSGRTKNVSNQEKYLLVDGYNIIFGWPELSALAEANIDGARERLNDILSNYRAVINSNLIVVYDAYRVAGHPVEYFKHHNICVVYTKEAETADKFIERFAHENSRQFDITVATSDGLEQIIIRGAGCKLLTAQDLLKDIQRIKTEYGDRFLKQTGSIGTRLGDKL